MKNWGTIFLAVMHLTPVPDILYNSSGIIVDITSYPSLLKYLAIMFTVMAMIFYITFILIITCK